MASASLTRNFCSGKAVFVLDKVEEAFLSPTDNPEHSAYLNELLAVGLREHQEIYFRPYRVSYRVIAQHVYARVIADGRRDKKNLLQRRLFQA